MKMLCRVCRINFYSKERVRMRKRTAVKSITTNFLSIALIKHFYKLVNVTVLTVNTNTILWKGFACAVKHLGEPFFELLCLPHFTSFSLFFPLANSQMYCETSAIFLINQERNWRRKTVIENTLKKLIYVNFFGYFVCHPHLSISSVAAAY